MARPKKIVETKDELIEVKDEVVETKTDEKTEAELALEAKDKEIQEMKTQMEMQEMKTQMEMQEMKIQMEMLMKQMMTTNQSVQVGKTNDIDVAVGCRALNGACLANKNGDIEYNIKYKEIDYIPYNELKECFKSNVNNYKDLFAKGIFYFEDEAMYDEFMIKNRIDLSEENLVKILLSNQVPFLDKLYIRGQKDVVLYMTVLYLVAELYSEGKLNEWSWDGRNTFETHYKIRLDDIVRQIQSVR